MAPAFLRASSAYLGKRKRALCGAKFSVSSRPDFGIMPINTRTLKRRANGQQVIIIDNSQTGDRSTRRREGILALQGDTLVLRTVSSTYIPKQGDEVNLYGPDFRLERFIYQPRFKPSSLQSE